MHAVGAAVCFKVTLVFQPISIQLDAMCWNTLERAIIVQVHRCVRKDSQEEYAVKVIDKTSLSSHEKSLLRGEIGDFLGWTRK